MKNKHEIALIRELRILMIFIDLSRKNALYGIDRIHTGTESYEVTKVPAGELPYTEYVKHYKYSMRFEPNKGRERLVNRWRRLACSVPPAVSSERIQYLINVANHKAPDDKRRAALMALSYIVHSASAEVLRASKMDLLEIFPGGYDRVGILAALDATGSLQENERELYFLDVLRYRHDDVCRAAEAGLVKINSNTMEAPLREMLAGSGGANRRSAFSVLESSGRLTLEERIEYHLTNLEKSRFHERHCAADIVNSEAMKKSLCEFLESGDRNNRRCAFTVLKLAGRLTSEEMVEYYLADLEKGRDPDLQRAETALVELDYDAMEAPLRQMLEDGSPNVRRWAFRILKRTNRLAEGDEEQIIEYYLMILRDPSVGNSENARRSAEELLIEVNADYAVPLLKTLLKCENFSVRQSAFTVLDCSSRLSLEERVSFYLVDLRKGGSTYAYNRRTMHYQNPRKRAETALIEINTGGMVPGLEESLSLTEKAERRSSFMVLKKTGRLTIKHKFVYFVGRYFS